MHSPLGKFEGLLLACSLLLISPPVIAREVYVSPTGSDSDAGTLAAPWGSILTAVRRTEPGDSILLRGGIYTEGEIWIQFKEWGGLPGKVKSIRNYPGEVPSLGGPRRLINQADWIRFEGLTFRLNYTFDNHEGNHVEVRNCHFVGPQPDYGAISFSGDHGLIEGNIIEITSDNQNTQDHGIYLLHASDTVIRGNFVSGSAGYGIHIYDEHKSEDPLGFVRRFDRIVIEDNYVTGSRHRSGIIATVSDTASMSNLTFRGNVLTANNHVGLLIGNAHHVQVDHNTFYSNGRQGLQLDGAADWVTIRRNLFVQIPNSACSENCSWFELRHIGAQGAPPNLEVTDNFYQPSEVTSDGPRDLGAVFGEARFVNAAGRDFRLDGVDPLCTNESPTPPFGALPCGEGVRLADVDFDSLHEVWRVRVIAAPSTRVVLESTTGLTPPTWEPSSPIALTSPMGAFFAIPLGDSISATRFYRAVVAP